MRNGVAFLTHPSILVGSDANSARIIAKRARVCRPEAFAPGSLIVTALAMTAAYDGRMGRWMRALIASAHPGPTAVVTIVATALGLVSGLPASTVALLTATVLTNQLSVGWSNDALDAGRDRAVGRTDKPVARGEIPERALLVIALVAAAAAIALSFALGPLVAVAHAVFLLAGWAYNLGLKRTLAATLCYAAGFAMLPLLVTFSASPPAVAAPWAIGMGALLGVAAHFANVLPDLADDRAHGIAALPHRLGAVTSAAVALGALVVTTGLGVFGPLASGAEVGPVSIAGVVLSLACVLAGTVILARARESRWLFRVIMLAALAAVLTLAGSAGAFRL